MQLVETRPVLQSYYRRPISAALASCFDQRAGTVSRSRVQGTRLTALCACRAPASVA
jgi:hypothetical protein